MRECSIVDQNGQVVCFALVIEGRVPRINIIPEAKAMIDSKDDFDMINQKAREITAYFAKGCVIITLERTV